MATNYANSGSIGTINPTNFNELNHGYDPLFSGNSGVSDLYAYNVRVPNTGTPVTRVEVQGAFFIGATIDDVIVGQGTSYVSLLTGKSYTQNDINGKPMAVLSISSLNNLDPDMEQTLVQLHTNMAYADDHPYRYINIRGVSSAKFEVYLGTSRGSDAPIAMKLSFYGNTLYQMTKLNALIDEVNKKMDSVLGDVINKFVAR